MGRKRPRYESEGDREREREFAKRMLSKYGLKMLKAPDSARFDFRIKAARDIRVDGGEVFGSKFELFAPAGTPLGICEVKHRDVDFHRYPDWFVEPAKVDAMERWRQEHKLPAFVFFWTRDGLHYYQLGVPPVDQLERKPGGRKDRDDAKDRGNLVHIPGDAMYEHQRFLRHLLTG